MVNFELAINEVKAWLRQDPGHFDTMAQHFDDCRAPGNLLYKFEMTQHPYVQSCIEETCFGNARNLFLRSRSACSACSCCDVRAGAGSCSRYAFVL